MRQYTKVDAWKDHFLSAVNRVREVEDKAVEAFGAAKAAKAAAKLAAVAEDAASESGAAFSVGGGDAAVAVGAKEKAAALEA